MGLVSLRKVPSRSACAEECQGDKLGTCKGGKGPEGVRRSPSDRRASRWPECSMGPASSWPNMCRHEARAGLMSSLQRICPRGSCPAAAPTAGPRYPPRSVPRLALALALVEEPRAQGEPPAQPPTRRAASPRPPPPRSWRREDFLRSARSVWRVVGLCTAVGARGFSHAVAAGRDVRGQHRRW